ncbi:MAG: PIN domain-containing protein [Bacteroidales bacterium]|nr:PIN domain-containing protein [Bacteroidales bacterium]
MEDGSKLFAVIDTNVVVSSLFSKDSTSSPVIVLNAVLAGFITPLYNSEILDEYKEVLSRPRFPFNSLQIDTVIGAFKDFGLDTDRTQVNAKDFPDSDDIVFYEVKMSVDDAFLVTGNVKHFPKEPFVVTPAEMVEILRDRGLI